MIRGVGADLCQISRIEKAMEKPRFLERWFAPSERAYIAQRGPQSAAGIFAAKEAVAKALGTGFSGFGPEQVEILHDEHGRPFCRLAEGAQARLEAIGAAEVLISISHDGGMALAFAVAQGPEISGPARGGIAHADHSDP